MWFSAINELWMFCFGAAALLCRLEAERRQRRWLDVCGVVLFALALISKESAVIFLPALLLAAPRRVLSTALPYVLLTAIAVGSILLTHSNSFRFTDGSFSLHAPFWITLPRNIGRLLWIWGIPALLVAWYSRMPELRRFATGALGWMALAFVPYMFLTYSRAIPSRQTYLASAGLAWLVGVALAHIWRRRRRWAAAAALVILLHNVGILFVRKRVQFLERAEPTEQLLALARRTAGPIWVQCFPRPAYIAQEALHLGAGRDPATIVWTGEQARTHPPAAVFCYHEK